MLITAIEKRRKMLSALFLDGEFAVNIDTETLLQFRYKIGMDITDEQLHELILASDARRASTVFVGAPQPFQKRIDRKNPAYHQQRSCSVGC